MQNKRKKFLTTAIGQSVLVLSSLTTSQLMAAGSETRSAPINLAHVSTSAITSGKSAETLLTLGRSYQLGEGVKRNSRRAFDYFWRAANMGLAEAQYQVAVMYLEGGAVSENEDEAIKWLERAAAQGHKNATHAYNYLLENTYYVGC